MKLLHSQQMIKLFLQACLRSDEPFVKFFENASFYRNISEQNNISDSLFILFWQIVIENTDFSFLATTTL